MSTTTTATTTTAPTADAAPRRLDERRIAGIGAIGFASIVILTNILQGATPAMDADADEVVSYITDHRTANIIATAAFAVAAPFLLAFASAFYGRLKAVGRAADLVWARLGMVGALLILPTFAAVVVNRLVLLVGTDEIIGSPELVTLVWRIEMAAFLLNTAADGGRDARLRHRRRPRRSPARWYRRWAPSGPAARSWPRPTASPVSRARPSASSVSSPSPRGCCCSSSPGSASCARPERAGHPRHGPRRMRRGPPRASRQNLQEGEDVRRTTGCGDVPSARQRR